MINEPQGGGSEPQKELSRPSAKEIYVQVAGNARDELKRSVLSLGISGFAGGIFMGFSGLGVAISTALLGSSAVSLFIAQMFYPLGFYYCHSWSGTAFYGEHFVSRGALISRAQAFQTHFAIMGDRPPCQHRRSMRVCIAGRKDPGA